MQTRFVDEPADAVRAGDELVTRLLREIGYPTDDYDERLATLSVEHARLLDQYREAHDISARNEQGAASTEQLRQALVDYRALFADLLGDQPVPPNRPGDPGGWQPGEWRPGEWHGTGPGTVHCGQGGFRCVTSRRHGRTGRSR